MENDAKITEEKAKAAVPDNGGAVFLNAGGEEIKFSPEELADIGAMIKAAVWRGRRHFKFNPKMTPYIAGVRREIDVIDLLKTRRLLDQAADFLKMVIEKKLPVLVVGTELAVRDLVKSFAEKLHWAYVTERWLGGTLTNFKVISKRIEYFNKIWSAKEKGELSKYTKKEQLMFSRELEKLTRNLFGIRDLIDLPAAVIIVGVTAHSTAVKEAKRLNIPIVGLINSDGNPEGIQYPIPANDSARSSVKWVLDELEKKLLPIKQAGKGKSE